VRIPGEPTEVPHGMVESQTQTYTDTQTHILDTHTHSARQRRTDLVLRRDTELAKEFVDHIRIGLERQPHNHLAANG
jgi:hypothetical protein